MSVDVIGSPIPPIPPIDGGIISTIIKVIKTIVDLFKKPAEEAGKTDQSESLENIERVSEIFSDFKDQVHTQADAVEKAVEDEVNYYVEELKDILDSNESIKKYGIRIKRIEKQIDRVLSGVKGTIDNELSKKISLDNIECKEIVKMIPGSKKESAMSNFFKRSVEEALDTCCLEIKSDLEEIYDEIEEELMGTVDSIQRQNEQLLNSLSSIDESNYEETAKSQMIEAYYLVDICDKVMNQL